MIVCSYTITSYLPVKKATYYYYHLPDLRKGAEVVHLGGYPNSSINLETKRQVPIQAIFR